MGGLNNLVRFLPSRPNHLRNILGNKHLDDEYEDDDLSDNNVGSILDEDSAIVHVEGENFLLFM